MSRGSPTGGFCRRCAGVIARIALASLQASHCHLFRHCAGVVTNVALASLPSLRWHCPQHCKLASAQPRHSCDTSVCMASLSWSLSLPMASLPYLALFHGDLASDGPADAALVSLPVLRWRPWPHCASSSPTLCCCCHRHCASIIALVAWALLPSLRWHFHLCCLCIPASIANWCLPSHNAVTTRAGVLASIAPLTLLALHWHRCPCRAGIFAPVTLALPPLAHPRCHQHHKLASSQSDAVVTCHW
jgi:hypothetical protein